MLFELGNVAFVVELLVQVVAAEQRELEEGQSWCEFENEVVQTPEELLLGNKQSSGCRLCQYPDDQ